ncbi:MULTISPECIES: hypothetical protein [unclassified Borrelia]|uniref:hypothetical protein n=1 Tax=unclassified Borrelia TaxID=2649934 RepID=UPI001E548526|nr:MULTISPECIES: hypothetical protein [unclassified Borrelia]UGQ16681.1 hypothetical protein LSO06_05020 [Borrelia sp. RT5S]UGQ17839.1 hypothetical protein LSO05_05255 [Borrelia sp. RT1S]
MKSIVRQIFVKYFMAFGIPEDAFIFDATEEDIERLLVSRSYNEPVLIGYVRGCNVEANYRTTAFLNKEQVTLVGLGHYQITLDIIGADADVVSLLEGKICSCTNIFFVFCGYRECKIQVDRIFYDSFSDYAGKKPLGRTSISFKMIFPLFRRQQLDLINLKDIKIELIGRR